MLSTIFTAASIIIGVASWAIVCHLTGQKEAWDTGEYFSVVYPLLCLLAGAMAFYVPRHSWRWAVWPFAAQAVWLTVTQTSYGLLPLGLIVFGVLSLPALIATRIGVWLAQKYE
jgi:peptidoglycan/LPS O-acetylase OafA/YrhL